MKLLHVPCYAKGSAVPAAEANLAALKAAGRLGVVAAAQSANQVAGLVDYLNEHGGKAVALGGILGCDQNAAKRAEGDVDAFLYLGSGLFHPLGVAYATGKPVLTLNPNTLEFDRISDEQKLQWEKRRRGRIRRAIVAETFGIAVSTKSGQFSIHEAFSIKARLEGAGREAYVFAGDFVSPETVTGVKVDCWVNTACPRIADDPFEKAVINMDEVAYVVVGEELAALDE